jgi:hypothetical protein
MQLRTLCFGILVRIVTRVHPANHSNGQNNTNPDTNTYFHDNIVRTEVAVQAGRSCHNPGGPGLNTVFLPIDNPLKILP